MEGDQDTVFGPLKVKFKIADAHLARQQLGGTGFLRGKVGGASVRDNSGTRDPKLFRQLFSSAPAIGDNADGEKQQTETSSQGSGRQDGLKRIEHAPWSSYRAIRADHEPPPRTARTQYWIALCSTPTLPSKKYTVQALDGSAA